MKDPILAEHLTEVDSVESTEVQTSPCRIAMELSPQARLIPLFEQPDAIVRDVLGDLSDFEIAQYREVCRSHSIPDGKTYKFQQLDSTDLDTGKHQTQDFVRLEIASE